MTPTKGFLSIREASEIISVSYNTIRSEILAGRLRASKFRGTYRINAEAFADYQRQAEIGEPAKVKPAKKPTPVGTFKHLNGGELLEAWRKQGVIHEGASADSGRSGGSMHAPSAEPES